MTRLSSALQCLLMCAFMPVNPGREIRPIALKLAADGAVMTTQSPGDFPQAELEQFKGVDDVAFL